MNQRNALVDAFAELTRHCDPDWKIDRIILDVAAEPPAAAMSTYHPGTRMVYEDHYQWDGHAWVHQKP